jgi:hypothetical protein
LRRPSWGAEQICGLLLQQQKCTVFNGFNSYASKDVEVLKSSQRRPPLMDATSDVAPKQLRVLISAVLPERSWA